MDLESPFFFGYYPALLQLGLTYRCNLKCPHCYALYHRTRDEFSLDELKRLIDDSVAIGACKVVYSHGENLIRRDFHEIANYVAQRDMYQTLMTNGYYLQTKEAVQRLETSGVNKVMVSIDSCDAGEHNTNRGQAKAYEWALASIRLLKQHTGLIVGISMAVDTRNYHRIEGVAKMAEDLNIDCLSVMQTRPNKAHTFAMYDWSSYQQVCNYLYETIVQYRGRLDVYTHDPFMNTLLDARISSPAEREAFLAHNACNVGKYMMSICPNGDVTGCNFIERVVGNVRNEPISTIWDRLVGDYDDREVKRGPCSTCSGQSSCQNGCKAFHLPYESEFDKRCDQGPFGTWPATVAPLETHFRIIRGAN